MSEHEDVLPADWIWLRWQQLQMLGLVTAANCPYCGKATQ